MDGITYEWVISALDCKVQEGELTNVVQQVHWRYKGTNEDGVTAETYGAQSIGDPIPENFTPYPNLTSDIVIAWLEDVMDVESLQENINNKINLKINPINVTLPLPIPSGSVD